MKHRPLYSLVLALLLTLPGCGKQQEASNSDGLASDDQASATVTANADAKSRKINWFDGSVEQAFAAARQQNKPLFLYWGAVWCPPCHELKATVFTRPDFIAASRQFIALHIDGDDPGAQQHAEQFGVMGYPTLVVFNSEGEEQTRIPNGLDVQVYANVLQNALGNMQPITDTMALAEKQDEILSDAQCRMLANHSWQQDPSEFSPVRLASVFSSAANKCSSDALYVMSLIQTQQAEQTLGSQQHSSATERLNKLVNNTAWAKQNYYLMLDAGEPLSDLLAVAPETRNANMQQGFSSLYKQLANDESISLILRIQALRSQLSLLNSDGEVELSEDLRADVDAMLAASKALPRDDPEFHATVNATANLLREAEYLTEAKELLSNEIVESKYAYYFMGELAYIEDLLGNKDQAVIWLRKAFDQSRGPATRFQWGVSYLSGLLELAPGDQTAIDKGFDDVFAEVAKSRAFYQRSRVRLQRLDAAFRDWAGEDQQRISALQRYRQSSAQVCSAIPVADPAHEHCAQFLGDV